MADLRSDRRGEGRVVVGEVYDEIGQTLAVKHANGKATASGDNTVLALVSGKTIRVLSYTLQAHGTVTVKFEDDATATQRGPEYDFEAREGVHAVAAPGAFLFETGAGVGLDINLSAAIDVAWHVVYLEAD